MTNCHEDNLHEIENSKKSPVSLTLLLWHGKAKICHKNLLFVFEGINLEQSLLDVVFLTQCCSLTEKKEMYSAVNKAMALTLTLLDVSGISAPIHFPSQGRALDGQTETIKKLFSHLFMLFLNCQSRTEEEGELIILHKLP